MKRLAFTILAIALAITLAQALWNDISAPIEALVSDGHDWICEEVQSLQDAFTSDEDNTDAFPEDDTFTETVSTNTSNTSAFTSDAISMEGY